MRFNTESEWKQDIEEAFTAIDVENNNVISEDQFKIFVL